MDKNQERWNRMKAEYENIPVPEEGLRRMERTIQEAKMEKKRRNRRNALRNTGLTVAAAFACVVVLANSSAKISMAMEKVPVLGAVVKAVTFREFKVDDNHYNADVKVPEILAEDENNSPELQENVEKINADIKTYTDAFIREFEEDMAKDGEGHEGLTVSYDVITDNDQLYTIKVSALQTAGSAAQSERYYHLDKVSGVELKLSDLFRSNSDYQTVISENIKEQMRTQMEADENKVYFLDDGYFENDNFKTIAADQNFYINNEGRLVIAFNEYEVAPGYMGSVEFVIPTEVIESILNPALHLIK